MVFEKFKAYFHYSYWGIMKKFIESEECNKIYKFLKERNQEADVKICPLSFNTYKTFYLTPLNDVNCVILGNSPYTDIVNDEPIASGTLFGAFTRAQNDLKWFYQGIEKELFNGFNLHYIDDNYNVEYLTSQGVLLLNSSLTSDAKLSHNEIWKPFIEYVFENIIKTSGAPIIVLGEHAKNSIKNINLSKTNNVYYLEFPKYNWNTKDVFTNVSKDIWNNNKETICWLPYDDNKTPF